MVGIRGILVHAISPDAKAFYLALGFETSPLEPLTLVATLADLRAAISYSRRCRRRWSVLALLVAEPGAASGGIGRRRFPPSTSAGAAITRASLPRLPRLAA